MGFIQKTKKNKKGKATHSYTVQRNFDRCKYFIINYKLLCYTKVYLKLTEQMLNY